MKKIKAFIQKNNNAKALPLPRYMTEGSAGVDLYAAIIDSITLKPGERKLIPTGISIALPQRYEAQIRPRSGLAIKHGVTLLNTPGTIDSDYRGEIKVIMINLGAENYTVNEGDRVAQMVLNNCPEFDFEECEELPETERSSGGFGHTGS